MEQEPQSSTDPRANFIGVWNRQANDLRSARDFGIFYIWMTRELRNGGEGFCWDELGYSDISFESLNAYEVRFSKRYSERAKGRGACRNELIYKGLGGHGGLLFKGDWHEEENSGLFVMSNRGLYPEEINRFLGECSMMAFGHQLSERRQEFPYCSLQEALKEL